MEPASHAPDPRRRPDGSDEDRNAAAGFRYLLADEVCDGPAHSVLDVGCGTGATTLAVARRPGPAGGHCLGADISEPMITAARERAARDGVAAEFVRADAGRGAATDDARPASTPTRRTGGCARRSELSGDHKSRSAGPTSRTCSVRGPCTPSTRSSSMSLVALGPLIQVCGHRGSSAATASGTPATT